MSLSELDGIFTVTYLLDGDNVFSLLYTQLGTDRLDRTEKPHEIQAGIGPDGLSFANQVENGFNAKPI